MTLNYRLILSAGILLARMAHSQPQQPIALSVFSEATTIPFTTFLETPFHPGLQIGTDFDWKESRHFKMYPALNIGYLFHNHLFQGLYVKAELGFDYKADFGLHAIGRIGLGYMRTFTTQQEYQFKNGSYQSNADKGNARLMPSATVGLGFTLNRSNPTSPEFFVLYESWLEYPYSPGFIPVMSHTSFHLGSKFYPFVK
jgi:hypothetical protein